MSGSNHFFCGVSWCDATYNCGNTPCPEQTECPEGQSCYADLPCDSENSGASSAPPLPQPPTASPYQFCGSSLGDAQSNCWQPCPRGENDCCFGSGCFDTSSEGGGGGGETCAISGYSGSNHYFCGSTWCDAAYSCTTACPDGTNDECPGGQYCYADVPCSSSGDNNVPPRDQPPDVSRPSSIYSKYCGTSKEDATNQCWQPCRDDDDCCAGQSCWEEVTTCPYPDNIGADHFFCGDDFCDAAFNCRLPCPSGFDAQCAEGMRCFSNTPCNANLRSGLFGDTGDDTTLRYGLPKMSLRLIQQYDPDLDEQYNPDLDGQYNPDAGSRQGAATSTETNQASGASEDASFSVGVVFSICIIVLFAVGSVLWRVRR
mmetsp:Transcript_884/g.1635  ORF Transcript_884/g.1635 Transcript_884/m.1635 type:complete len:372 (-) Transcript_884:450-1565(-)